MPLTSEANGCGEKHETQAAALGHMGALICMGRAWSGGLTAYQCEHCQKWHVGHRRTRREDR